jgi:hypothetical protein
VDIEEVNEKVEKVLALVGTDITHRVMTEWLNKTSSAAQKQFGDAVLALIPRVAQEVVTYKLRHFAETIADTTLAALRPAIEAHVKAEVEKQAASIAATIAERVRQRAPQVAEQHVSELIRKAARGG